MSVRHGYTFEAEIGASLAAVEKELDIWYIKLVDTRIYEFKIRCQRCHHTFVNPFIAPKALADFQVFRVEKPPIYLECKSSKVATSFPLYNIEDHQYSSSLKCSYYGIPFYFIICDRRFRRKFKAYAISADVMDDIRAEVAPQKSVRWAMIEERGKALERIKHEEYGWIWDVKELINI